MNTTTESSDTQAAAATTTAATTTTTQQASVVDGRANDHTHFPTKLWFSIQLDRQYGYRFCAEESSLSQLAQQLQAFLATATRRELDDIRNRGTITVEPRYYYCSSSSSSAQQQQQPPPMMDWKNHHDFVQAVTSIECRKMLICNFLQFPLLRMILLVQQRKDLILNLVMSDSTAKRLPSSMCFVDDNNNNRKETTRIAFGGEVCFQLESIDWNEFFLWLQEEFFLPKTLLGHPESCLQLLVILHPQQNNNLDNNLQALHSCGNCLERLLSIPTKHLVWKGVPDQYSNQMLKSLPHYNEHDHYHTLERMEARFRDTEFWAEYRPNRHILHLMMDDKTNWKHLSEWLYAIVTWLFPQRCRWHEIRVALVRSTNTTHTSQEQLLGNAYYQQVVQILFSSCCSSTTSLEIYVPQNHSWLASDLLRRSSSPARALRIFARDDSWILSHLEQSFSRTTTTVQELHVTFLNKNQPNCLQNFEALLAKNHSISFLQLNRAQPDDDDQETRQRVQMYLRLNKNGKQTKLLLQKEAINGGAAAAAAAHHHHHHLTPEEWVDFLVTTNKESNDDSSTKNNKSHCADSITLSCLFFFVSKNPSLYATLALLQGSQHKTTKL